MSLRVVGLTKKFGELVAVNDVSFTVERGEMVGVIGPNGSGKTTLFNTITGVLKPDKGEVWFEGKRIDGLLPHEVYRHGIVRGFQIPRTFQKVTVSENLMLAPKGQKGEKLLYSPFRKLWVEHELELAYKAREVLELLRIQNIKLSWASEVSGGQMKLTEVGRAVMGGGKLVLLDEPAAGVAVPLAIDIFRKLNRLNKELGITFMIIEHRLDLLFEYVGRVLVMHEGRIIYDGPPDGVAKDAKVVEAYLGDEAADYA